MKRYRYERKFLTPLFREEALAVIRNNPAHFSSIHQPRKINNIYFDTPGFDFYYDNIDGERNRFKVRIRWYGEEKNKAVSPVLEFKLKTGLFGEKLSYPLPDFPVLGEDLNFLTEIFRSAAIDQQLLHRILGIKPVLFNSYHRDYFISADGRFRLTLDDELDYYPVSPGPMRFLAGSKDYAHRIFELKYDLEQDREADAISSRFPFRLTKNSKYLTGIERVWL